MKMTPEVMTAEGQAAARGVEQLMSRLSQEGRALSSLVLFFAAPLVGLVYIVIFPFVGFAALAGALVKSAHAGRS
jgi:hypothetical protein